MRRLLAGIGVEVVGHAQAAAQLTDLLGRNATDFIVLDAADPSPGVAEMLGVAAASGVALIVLSGEDRVAPPAGAPRAQVLVRPAELELAGPRAPFARALAAALTRCDAPVRKAAPALAIRPRPLLAVPPALIAIGSSTGGPQALPRVLAPLGTKIRQPIVITQHMPPTFTQLLAEHLGRNTAMPTVQAAEGMPLLPGRIHIAPGGHHLLFARRGDQVICVLDDGPPENFCKPAVDPMLRSVVDIYGGKALAVILTGMGHDGLAGCQSLVAAGGQVLAQDEETSVVWGMPGAVAQAGLCSAVLPIGEIGDKILAVAGGRA